MNNTIIDTTKITRLEIINHASEEGRKLVEHFKAGQLQIQIQDYGRTIKVFIV